MFQALALCQSKGHSDEGLALERSVYKTLYGGQITFICQLSQKKKTLFCNTAYQHTTKISLETYPQNHHCLYSTVLRN